jgi:hypothetical protein
MKSILHLICLLCSLSVMARHPFVYLNPLPDSKYNYKASNLIVRPGYTMTDDDIALLGHTQVEGTVSGNMAYTVSLAEKNTVAILKFRADFVEKEQVTVRFSPALKGKDLQPTGGYSFTFMVAKQSNITDKQAQCPYPPEYCQQLETPAVLGGNDFTTHTLGVTDTGYVFFDRANYDIQGIDNDGNIEYDAAGFGTIDASVQNGHLLYGFFYYNQRYVELDTNYTIVRTIKALNGIRAFPLEMIYKPNGNVILYGRQYVEVDMTAYGGDPAANVLQAIVQEITPTDQLVWEWKALDHISPADGLYDDDGPIDLTASNIETGYVNAMCLDLDGNLLINHRNMCEITKVNLQTGDIMWRLGGKNNQFTFVNDSLDGFTRQHHCRILPNGHLTVFDNGLFHPNPLSRGVEYVLDTAAKTATLVWSFPSPNTVISPWAGNVQQLANGNRLINWGQGRNYSEPDLNTLQATEIDSNNNIVWTLQYDDGTLFAYRVLRFPWKDQQHLVSANHSLFNGSLQTVPLPNPANQEVRIELTDKNNLGTLTLTLADMQGNTLSQQEVTIHQKTHQWRIPTAHLPSGTYLYEVQTSNQIKSGRFTVVH